MATGHYNLAVMPKRRVPGHLQRTGRRRRDREPNVPPLTDRPNPSDDAIDNPGAAARPPEMGGGRPLRPTQRAAVGARFVRTQQPSIDMATEYRYVLRDLRQIGLLAAVAFVILGVLAVVIR
jgi:hypothetical protein